MRSLSTPPVILESNYTSELQSSFGIEIKPGKNHNRPGLIIYPSEGFLIAKLCFSQCYWRSSDNPWFFFIMRIASNSRPILPWENSNTKNLWIFHQPTDQNWELNITQWFNLSCAESWCKKIQWRCYFSRNSAAFAKQVQTVTKIKIIINLYIIPHVDQKLHAQNCDWSCPEQTV